MLTITYNPFCKWISSIQIISYLAWHLSYNEKNLLLRYGSRSKCLQENFKPANSFKEKNPTLQILRQQETQPHFPALSIFLQSIPCHSFTSCYPWRNKIDINKIFFLSEKLMDSHLSITYLQDICRHLWIGRIKIKSYKIELRCPPGKVVWTYTNLLNPPKNTGEL